MSDSLVCMIFGIDFDTSDIFKEYFFLHGIYAYRSTKPGACNTPEYHKVINFFKSSQTENYHNFVAIPFAKIGYGEFLEENDIRQKLAENLLNRQ